MESWRELELSVRVLIEQQDAIVLSSTEKLALYNLLSIGTRWDEDRQFQLLLQIMDFVGRCKTRVSLPVCDLSGLGQFNI